MIGVATSTVAMTLPAIIGRLNDVGPAMAMTSDTRPASSSAATRGSRSLPVDVAVAATTVAPLSFAALATIGANVSAR